MYYTYIWKHPNGVPFYVGATKSVYRTNPRNKTSRNAFAMATHQRIGAGNVIYEVHTLDSMEEALSLEAAFIAEYGRICEGTGSLTNITPGGDNSTSIAGRAALSAAMKISSAGGKNPSKRPEVRAKLVAVWENPEYREHQRIAHIGKLICSEENRERLRQIALDPNSPLQQVQFHKILNTDPDIKAKRVAAIRTPESRAKKSATLNDPEKKTKRLATLKATIASPEYQAKLDLRRKPKPPKLSPEELRILRSERMKAHNADKEYTEKRLAGIRSPEGRAKISAGVYASMEQRLVTMQTPEVQAKLRAPKSDEYKAKMSEVKRLYWETKKGT